MTRSFTFITVLVLTVTFAALTLAQNQNTLIVATPEQQARIKPLVDAETKAREALNAKIATLPESKAYKEAEEALKRASEALNKAAENLPENAAWKLAGAQTLDAAYAAMAEHKLSSREYHPELNKDGKLVFPKNVKP